MARFLPPTSWPFRPFHFPGINVASPQLRGLVTWFPVSMEDRFTSATTGVPAVRDVIRNTYATNEGACVLVPAVGLIGGPVSMAGGSMLSNSAGSVAYYPFTPPQALFSVEATFNVWCQLRAATPAISGNSGFLALQGAAASPTHYPFTDGNIYCATFLASNRYSFAPLSSVNRTLPHMVTITTDGTSWKFYQNAQLVHTNTADATIPTFAADTALYGTSPRSLDGGMWDARIYNRCLSPAEIYALWHPATRNDLYAPIPRRRLFVVPASSSVTLDGASAIATWAAAAGAVATTVGLAGATAAAAWTVPAGAFATVVALAGASGIATWAPADGTVSTTLGLTGSGATSAWSVPDGSLTVGVDLTGTTATATWAAPAAALETTVALSGAEAVATWSAAAGAITTGLALAGAAAVATWHVAAGSLEVEGTATLDGATATAAWAVPTGTLAIIVSLSGATATATWTVADGALGTGVPLAGDTAVASWTVAAGALDLVVGLSASPAVATWEAAAGALTTQFVLTGQSAVATWETPLGAFSVVNPNTYTVLRIAAARAGRNGITARAGRSSLTARTHLSE